MRLVYSGRKTDAPADALGISEPGYARSLTVYDAKGDETIMNHFVGASHFTEWECDTRVSRRIITRAIARRRALIYSYFASYGELPGRDCPMEYEI